MDQYIVRYGLSGTGGANIEEVIDAPNLDQANLIAYEMACEVYDSYDRIHHIGATRENIREEYPDYSDEIIDQMWVDYRKSFLEYSAEPLNNQDDDEYDELLKDQLKFWDSMIERLENINHQPTKISLGLHYREEREKVAMQIDRRVK